MTEKAYFSPIASRTVDAKLQLLKEATGVEFDSDDDNLEVRDVRDRNDLDLENTEDAPYA